MWRRDEGRYSHSPPDPPPATATSSVPLVALGIEEQYEESASFRVAFGAEHAGLTGYAPSHGDQQLLLRARHHVLHTVVGVLAHTPSGATRTHQLMAKRPDEPAGVAQSGQSRRHINRRKRTYNGRTLVRRNSLELALKAVRLGPGVAQRFGAVAAAPGPPGAASAAAARTHGAQCLAEARARATSIGGGAGEGTSGIPSPNATLLPTAGVLLRFALFHQREKVREIEVRAAATLDVLATCLHCISAVEIAYQCAELVERNAASAAAHAVPSSASALCIEGRWYLSGGSGDPSSETLAWLVPRRAGGGGEPSASATSAGAATVSSQHMEHVRLGELWMRLGRQYLFVHRGDCEHALVLTKCWLASAAARALVVAAGRLSDARLVFLRRWPPLTCSVCARTQAAWQRVGAQLADEPLCYLCPDCHSQSHYTREGVSRCTELKSFPVLHGHSGADHSRKC